MARLLYVVARTRTDIYRRLRGELGREGGGQAGFFTVRPGLGAPAR